jgi:two-component system chemotaxis sensor kinase CheA
MDSFEQELRMGFFEEAGQLLADAEQCFLALEQSQDDPTILDQLFRIAHNIKGSSRAVGFEALGAFMHEFESFMLKCKNGQYKTTPLTISLLLKCNDHIRRSLDGLKQDPDCKQDHQALIAEILAFDPNVFEEDDSATSFEEPSVGAEPLGDTNAPTEESIPSGLEPATSSSEEAPSLSLVPAPALAAEPAPSAAPSASSGAAPPTTGTPPAGADESIRVSLARLERLINFVGELVILQTVLKEQSFGQNPLALRKTAHQIGKVTKEVQELSMSLRMVPMRQTFQKMQRIVRDTSSVLSKKVNLQLQGEDTEVDKTVLDALGDPLVHLIRNAVDHGIEMPAERVAAGKSENGTVCLRARHQSGKLVIEIIDDGAGIMAERIIQKATEKGILKPGQKISASEAIQLIFHPGFSTKAEVTEVSGRGVGMDVVKTNIERMQGEVTVETQPGKGSTFRIALPLTLAIIDGMIVRCGDDRYVIPLSQVHESVKPAPNDLKQANGIGEVLLLRGENLPVFRLSYALNRKARCAKDTEQIAIIVRTGPRPFAILVDDVIGQHQVVIKKLGGELRGLKGYSGSAILGDGKPALILEVADLVADLGGSDQKPQRMQVIQ